MSPADFRREFVVGVAGVVDDEIRAFDQRQYALVLTPWDMLGVRDITDTLARVLDAIPGGAVRMIELGGLNLHIRAKREAVSSREVVELELGAHRLEGHRKYRLRHLTGEHVAHLALTQVSSHDAKASPWRIRRR